MNWNLPTLTSLYTDVIDLMKERTEDVATMFRSSSSTNIPTGSIRWSDLNSRLESWNGSAWVELDSLYEMKVRDSVNAEIGTKLATARTIAISGDATGSTTFDGTANKTISLSLTASQVLAKLKTVDTNTSGLNSQYLQGKQPSDFLGLIDAGTKEYTAKIESNDTLTIGYYSDGWKNAVELKDDNLYYTGSNGIESKIWSNKNDGTGSGLDADTVDGKHASDFNQVIGTDTDINTSGATIPDRFYFTDGVCTSHGTRTLTASDLGVADYDAAHSFTTNGYQKLENGLILQWIKTPSTGDGGTTTFTFPISFTSSVFFIGTTKEGSANYTGSGDDRVLSYTNSSFVFAHGTVAGTNFIFALGV